MILAEIIIDERGPKAEAEDHKYDSKLKIVGDHEGELVGIGQVPQLPGVEDEPKDIQCSAKGEKDEVEFHHFPAYCLHGELQQDDTVGDQLNKMGATLRKEQVKKEDSQVRNISALVM